MKKSIIVFLAFLIYNLTFTVDNCEAQWVYQYTASQYALLNKIQFPTENTGYSIGELPFPPQSVFLKTTNGGNNWINLNISLSFQTDLIEMSFANENTGYICGRSIDIYKTTNGGINWITIQVPYFGNQIWNSMQFLNVNTGFIAGRYGMRSKTTNGGANWISMDTTWRDIYDLYFLNPATGFMADGQGFIQKTTNGGINWATTLLIDSLNNGYSLQKIDFSNNNTGYVVGLNTVTGAIFKTTDNGNTWKNILITPFGLLSLKVVNSSVLYSGGESKKVLYSTNSGVSWNYQTISPTIAGINSIYFTNDLTGYLCLGGEIYKTTNGGVNILTISSEIPIEFKLFQNYPNPFNPSTKIRYALPRAGEVKLIIFDALGREVESIVNERQTAGSYEASFDGSQYPSGVYFYRFTAEGFSETKKMLLIR